MSEKTLGGLSPDDDALADIVGTFFEFPYLQNFILLFLKITLKFLHSIIYFVSSQSQ